MKWASSGIDHPGDDCCAGAGSKHKALAGYIMNQLNSGNEKGLAPSLSVEVGGPIFGGVVGLLLRSWEWCDVRLFGRRSGPTM
jgi:hypothetical protein